MPYRDVPINEQIRQFVTEYFSFIVLAIMGGLSKWVEREKGHRGMFDLLHDMVISSFSGMLALLVTNNMPINFWVRGAIVGICARMGNEILEKAENKVLKIMKL